jgi:hypothetical protein
VTALGEKFLAAIEANKLTIDELREIADVLEHAEPRPLVVSALNKARWHIAASRNELTDDCLLVASEGKTT